MTGQDTTTVRVKAEIDEDALREAIVKVLASHMIVKPGETLVIRANDWYPDQAEQYQDYLDARGLPFAVLVVLGDELAIAKPDETFMTDVDVEEIWSAFGNVRTGVVLTHRPTSVRMNARDLEGGILMLGNELVLRGAITEESARAAIERKNWTRR